MDLSDEATYDISVMARLRFPDDGAQEDQIATEEHRDEFIREVMTAYESDFSRSWTAYERNGGHSFDPPDPLLDELSRTADQVSRLTAYLDRLIVYARLFAAETSSARTIAEHTGVSHSTIVRTATTELVRAVAAQAQPVARSRMKNLDPLRNPVFYRRLASVAAPASESDCARQPESEPAG
jgi:hypothetical protein